MKPRLPLTTLFTLLLSFPLCAREVIPNRLIDYNAFEKIVVESRADRESSRLSEVDFLQALRSSDYILLDARSEKNFKLRHITGAKIYHLLSSLLKA